jgi:hypothetical protein
MAKIVIRNQVEPQLQPVIEAKLQIMLGSMLAYTSRVEIELDRDSQSHGKRPTYTCSLSLLEDNGERYALRTDQPDAELAVEGAVARVRRAMVRRSRARIPGRRQASAQ